jgi:hypothetical protein
MTESTADFHTGNRKAALLMDFYRPLLALARFEFLDMCFSRYLLLSSRISFQAIAGGGEE